MLVLKFEFFTLSSGRITDKLAIKWQHFVRVGFQNSSLLLEYGRKTL